MCDGSSVRSSALLLIPPVAGSDYSIAPNATLTIDKCARYGCIYITIVDDPIVEEMEKFRVSLTNITDLSRITFRRRTTRVLINDIDGNNNYYRVLHVHTCI